jgi:ABC-type phosphate transport system ATPase subunit
MVKIFLYFVKIDVSSMIALENIVIETSGQTKFYKDVKALISLNLKVPKNSIFGFLGPNECTHGKNMKWSTV